PFGFHILDFRQKPNLLPSDVVITATGRLMVNQLGVWRPNDPVASLTQPQAKIDVVESNREIHFIEAADLQVNISSHDRASCGYCRQILRQVRPSKVAWLVPHPDVCMAGNSACAQNHSTMLDRAVRIPAPCANHPCLRPSRVAHQLAS